MEPRRELAACRRRPRGHALWMGTPLVPWPTLSLLLTRGRTGHPGLLPGVPCRLREVMHVKGFVKCVDYYKQKSFVELSFWLLLYSLVCVSHRLSYGLFEGRDHVFFIFRRVPSLLVVDISLLNFINIGICFEKVDLSDKWRKSELRYTCKRGERNLTLWEMTRCCRWLVMRGPETHREQIS